MSITIDPPQPQGQGQYPLSALMPSTIKEFANQSDYVAKTGKPVPAYNPQLPVKRWIDSSVPAGTFSSLTYNTAHLDPSGQRPIVTQISVPGFLAGQVNILPDSGPIAPSPAGELLVPIRALLPNEILIANPFGISVCNTDIYNPNAPAGATPTSGGGFTDADRATANSTLALVTAIAGAMQLKV